MTMFALPTRQSKSRLGRRRPVASETVLLDGVRIRIRILVETGPIVASRDVLFQVTTLRLNKRRFCGE